MTQSDDSPESADGGANAQPAATPQWPSSGGEPSGGQPYGSPGQPNPGPTPPPPPAYGPMPQTSNSAIVALVLSIVSWVICPVIPAIIALVFANKADREVAASNGWVTGGGLITAAKIVSWINIGLYAAIIAIGLIFVLIAAAGGVFSSM